MSGQATVAIDGKQWSVAVASTPTELTTGLSGVSGIPANTGMLFDMGSDLRQIAVDMSRMLFALDIIFINSTRGVVGISHNVQPGEHVYLHNNQLPGARFFLEVNAGEAQCVEIGYDVVIQGDIQPAFWAGLVTAVMAMAQIAIVGVTTYRTLKEGKE